MGKPAARVTDNVSHPIPPVLTGIGSLNVFIGKLPAWRGVPVGVARGLQTAKKASDAVVKTAEAATKAAGTSPLAPAALAAETAVKATAAATMGSTIASSAVGADIHVCLTPSPVPHGGGVVIDGSKTVLINGLPACRQGDTVLEPVGPPNKIVRGCFTVLIGN